MESETSHNAIVSRCSCGVARDLCGWERLPYVGIQPDEPHPLELRNCTVCGSTLGVPLTPALAMARARPRPVRVLVSDRGLYVAGLTSRQLREALRYAASVGREDWPVASPAVAGLIAEYLRQCGTEVETADDG